MQSNQDETVHMHLEGELADLLARCDPQLYQLYVMTDNGKTILYVELLKALYSTLQAALCSGKTNSKTCQLGIRH